MYFHPFLYVMLHEFVDKLRVKVKYVKLPYYVLAFSRACKMYFGCVFWFRTMYFGDIFFSKEL